MIFTAKNLQHRMVQIILAALLTLFSTAPISAASCRHALVLALDISGSVDSKEYSQQIEGLSAALLSPKVQRLILDRPDAPVSIAVFEWSSERHQKLILNWIKITDAQTLTIVARTIRGHRKDRETFNTAIGSALLFGKILLDQRTYCTRRTIDISSDGGNNDGITPKELYATHSFQGVTVNALVVSLKSVADQQNLVVMSRQRLQDYFNKHVIHGPDAFSMLAVGYEDYERAMTQKLLKELAPAVVSDKGKVSGKKLRPL